LSLLTAAVAATFVKQDEKPEELRAELREIASRLDRIERALGEREASDYPEVVSSFIGFVLKKQLPPTGAKSSPSGNGRTMKLSIQNRYAEVSW
jgi:hypothetical protein